MNQCGILAGTHSGLCKSVPHLLLNSFDIIIAVIAYSWIQGSFILFSLHASCPQETLCLNREVFSYLCLSCFPSTLLIIASPPPAFSCLCQIFRNCNEVEHLCLCVYMCFCVCIHTHLHNFYFSFCELSVYILLFVSFVWLL